MDYIELIQNAIDYIDDHIEDDITVDELASLAGFSTYHFYRVFHSIVGYTVMEYVQKRRLQFALYYLQSGDKILDIAVRFRFETHSGFSKSFRKFFGYSPSFYRVHSPKNLPNRLDLGDLKTKKTGGIIMQPKIMELSPFKVLGYEFKNNLKNRTHTRDIPAFWAERGLDDGKYESMLYKKLSPPKHGEYCICINTDVNTDDFSYILGVGVDDFSKKDSEMRPLEIQGGLYAIFTSPGVQNEDFVSSIQGTWKYILEDWFPNSGYEIDDSRLDFEYYDERCHPWENDKISMEIYIPIIDLK